MSLPNTAAFKSVNPLSVPREHANSAVRRHGTCHVPTYVPLRARPAIMFPNMLWSLPASQRDKRHGDTSPRHIVTTYVQTAPELALAPEPAPSLPHNFLWNLLLLQTCSGACSVTSSGTCSGTCSSLLRNLLGAPELALKPPPEPSPEPTPRPALICSEAFTMAEDP